MVENALSRRSRKATFLAPFLEPWRPSLFDHFFDKLSNFIQIHSGTKFWNQIHPRRTKMSPREPLRLQRAKKLHLQKGGFRVGLSAFFHS